MHLFHMDRSKNSRWFCQICYLTLSQPNPLFLFLGNSVLNDLNYFLGILAVNMSDKYEEYDYEEVQGRAGRKGRSKAEVNIMSSLIILLNSCFLTYKQI